MIAADRSNRLAGDESSSFRLRMLRSFWLRLFERENAHHPVTAGHDVQDSTFWYGVTRTIAVASVLQGQLSVTNDFSGAVPKKSLESLEKVKALKYEEIDLA